MHRLELSDLEHETLKKIIQDELSEAREGIRRSETFTFTDDLKKDKAVLSHLYQKLEANPEKPL